MAKATNTKTTKSVRSAVAGKVVRSSTSVAAHQPGPDDVALRAYALYELGGRQDGRHVEHWLQAEAELLGRSS